MNALASTKPERLPMGKNRDIDALMVRKFYLKATGNRLAKHPNRMHLAKVFDALEATREPGQSKRKWSARAHAYMRKAGWLRPDLQSFQSPPQCP
jgi:hypothetical protein